MPHVMTVNSGSSSLKFGLFALGPGDPAPLCTGLIERIGGSGARVHAKSATGEPLLDQDAQTIPNHADALDRVLSFVAGRFPGAEIACVGHRVVHGGPERDAPLELSAETLQELERYAPFAPLHQPANLAGVRAAMSRFPHAAQVACFDTAFHRHHPWENDTFALPRELYDKGVRRYGFHGLSYDYIAGHLLQAAPLLHAGRVIVAHLGNGASMCGMLGGRSVGSTMGFSALDGLPMGTRCGQLDPGVVLYLMEQEGMGASEISDLLYKKSGLLGLSGLSNDMRTLEAAGTQEARQAIRYFTFRIRRELGALAAVLGGLDAVVFTGGIGENSAHVRAEVCAGMAWIGLEVDPDANAANMGEISSGLSRVRVLVIPTNEELVIARAAAKTARARQTETA
ncbi:MAG: acetate/propionate family kinase [Pseudomonadota bacterium]